MALPGIGGLLGAVERDPHFGSVKLLMPGDDLLDHSGNNYPILVNGNVVSSNANVKYGPKAIHLDGLGDWMTSDNTFPAIGTQNFTMEMWFYWNNVTARRWPCLFDFRPSAGSDYPFVNLNQNSMIIELSAGGSKRNTAITKAQWHHVALTRQSNILRLWLNGSKVGSDLTYSTNMSSRALTLGSYVDQRVSSTGDSALPGAMEDIRLTIGVARYGTTFAPPGKLPVS